MARVPWLCVAGILLPNRWTCVRSRSVVEAPRALAVTSAQRTSVAPELPTIAEAGVAGYAVDGWYGMLMPRQTTPHIVTRFANSLHRALQAGDVKQRLASQGLDTAVSTPDEFRKMIAADIAKWAKVVRDAGIQPE